MKLCISVFQLVPRGRLFYSRCFQNVNLRFTHTNIENEVNIYTDRTHTCGQLTDKDVGSNVSLYGWLEFQRMDKFAVLRDAYGSTQIIVPDHHKQIQKDLKNTPLESVVAVKGKVNQRPNSQINENMKTGRIEVVVSDYKVLNAVIKSLPFTIREYKKAKENLRMKYRYLDLRYPRLQNNLRVRSELFMRMRDFLINHSGFVEVETPTLFKRTPGGAQEFIVPTRFAGEFYSLVQSPQQLKQLLMVGGTDRYFQIARCYRDEGARPDRQPEFTQLDIELSFSSSEGVMQLVEDLLVHSWPGHLPPLDLPVPRLAYADAIQNYGTDKPDLRFNVKISKVDELVQPGVQNLSGNWKDMTARAITIPQAAVHLKPDFRKEIESMKRKMFPNTLFLMVSVSDNFEKDIKDKSMIVNKAGLQESVDCSQGDLLFISLGEEAKVLELLGRVRSMVLNELTRRGVQGEWGQGEHHSLLWVVDFPLFTAGDSSDSLVSTHHPFTQPHPKDIHLLDIQPLQVSGLHYDLVLNGCEIGGGSERIHDASLQQHILRKLNIPVDNLRHLMDALASGAPPHAGIALGLDRLVSLVVGAESIRDVIAFPKGSDGRDTMCNAPSGVSPQELQLYHVRCDIPQPVEAEPKRARTLSALDIVSRLKHKI